MINVVRDICIKLDPSSKGNPAIAFYGNSSTPTDKERSAVQWAAKWSKFGMNGIVVAKPPMAASKCTEERQRHLLVDISPKNPNRALFDKVASLLPLQGWRRDRVLRLPVGATCKTTWGGWVLSAGGMANLCGPRYGWTNISGCVCFKELHIPMYTAFRPPKEANLGVPVVSDHQQATKKSMFAQLHDRLVNGMAPPPGRPWGLIYAHKSTPRRNWENVDSFVDFIRAQGINHFSIVHDLVQFPPREQCALFYNASWIVMPHGGQEANVICCRPGTFIVQLACPASVNLNVKWLSVARSFRQELELHYTYIPATCNRSQNGYILHWNFTMSPSHLTKKLFPTEKLFQNLSRVGASDGV